MDIDMTYPKEIVTIEKITEDSQETRVVTVVNNESEENAVKTANAFMDAFNASDVEAIQDTLNFPHPRMGAEGNLRIMTGPEESVKKETFIWLREKFGWNKSCWDYRQVLKSSELKVHLDVQFSRYREDGSKIGDYPSLWVMTDQDGHWGIQMRSSFAP